MIFISIRLKNLILYPTRYRHALIGLKSDATIFVVPKELLYQLFLC